jgi:predicted amidohydrolase YtcJ
MYGALLLLVLRPPLPADFVVENARIWTPEKKGFARFAAVRDGRFVYVGTPNAQWIGKATRRWNARGRVVIPGLIDSHVHLLSGGLGLSTLQLRDASDKADFIRRVRQWASTLSAGEWVLGGRWSTESWKRIEQPTKTWIDEACGGRPAYLPRMDGHSALVNSEALRLAGITRDGPPDPPGGVIERDPATKEPTGILRESAMGLVSRLIPAPTLNQKRTALEAAIRHANRFGITAVSDIPNLEDLPVYASLAKKPDAALRLFLYPTVADFEAALPVFRNFSIRPGWIEVRGFKAYLDGSLGSRTAYMRAPFQDNPPDRKAWRGMLREGVEDGRFLRNAKAAAAAGYQTIAHAIGDEANHLLLDALRQAYPDLKEARCRSEHCQHLLPEDVPRFGALGVIPSMQPYHKADDGRYAESYIGAARAKSSYAFRSLLRGGAKVAFGSDWPVVSLDPFLGIEAAVTGKTLDGKAWQVQENLTVTQALTCYTVHGAYAVFQERFLGRIEPGYAADFVVLDASPFENLHPKIGAVFVGGRQVFPSVAGR